MLYPTKNPDNLYYSGALIYDFDVVSTIGLEFTNFTLKFWDYFYELSDIDQLGFRASVYDPRYFMPS